MRAQLTVVLLASLLTACSDNQDADDGQQSQTGDSVPAASKKLEPGERPDLEDQQGKQDIEAGQRVTEPSPPEWAEDEADDSADGQAAGEDPAATRPEPSGSESNSGGPDAGESTAATGKIYERYCTACHEKGMAGAPKISATAEWQKRVDERGLEGLVKHSVKGYRAMPAKGTCMDCTEEELRATIKWMLDEAGVEK